MPYSYEEVAERIAGNVVMGPNSGQALRAWRERLMIRQVDLAREMQVSSSVLSDYESGRRSSPGVGFVRRYVEALVRLDRNKSRMLERLIEKAQSPAILAIGEFREPVKASRLVELLRGQVLEGKAYLDMSIYGYTVLDSIKAIYALSGFDFYRVFGATTERALVFTKVGLGRSPLVAIRVSQLKPRMVTIHGPKAVDPLAVELAGKEKIILVLSSLESEDAFVKVLSKL